MELAEILQLIDAVSSKEHMGSLELTDGTFRLVIRTDKAGGVPAAGQERPMEGVCMTELSAASAETVMAGEKADAKKQTASQEEERRETAGAVVKAPLVGTFYAAPAEGAKPFVEIGDQVKKGQVLAIVEAMKLMNEIESEFDGTVEEILAQNGELVEYGQPLFRIARS